MKLILEERISELNEDNSFYLGGLVSNLKHGRGKVEIEIRDFSRWRLLKDL